MNKLSLAVTAGTPERFSVPNPSRYWRIVSAPAGAALTLVFDDASWVNAVAGTWGYRFQPRAAYSFVEIGSTVTGTVVLEWGIDELVFDIPGVQSSGSVLETVTRPDLTAVVETFESSLAATTAADVSLNVATGTPIYSVEVSLDPAAPGAVRYSLDATVASATRGVWLRPGETNVCYITTRSVVGFRAISWYNPNAVAVNIETRTYTR